MNDKPSYYFDAFVSKFDSYATDYESLVYSTHLGGKGDDYVNSIAVDRDAFITKLAANGLTLVYSSYLGSDWNDRGLDVIVDKAGYTYVSGFGGKGFPTTTGVVKAAIYYLH